MERSRPSGLTLALVALATTTAADPWVQGSPGSLVSLEVLLEGRPAPLYPAPDGSARWYVEAREGARYAIRLLNRTSGRLAVSLSVDGLDVISGERRGPQPWGSGRLYVIEPWEPIEVRGWRTSLQDVQQFVFVDERASYAARTGQGNARTGWIELAAYRERHARSPHALRAPGAVPGRPRQESGEREQDAPLDRAEPASGQAAPLPPPASAPPALGAPASSYPGTGWGPLVYDPVEVVAFDPEARPAERVTLRYEYRQGLRALGIDLECQRTRDRLRERERGEGGFAKPPGR